MPESNLFTFLYNVSTRISPFTRFPGDDAEDHSHDHGLAWRLYTLRIHVYENGRVDADVTTSDSPSVYTVSVAVQSTAQLDADEIRDQAFEELVTDTSRTDTPRITTLTDGDVDPAADLVVPDDLSYGSYVTEDWFAGGDTTTIELPLTAPPERPDSVH